MKRLVACFLVLCLILCMVPMTAYAMTYGDWVLSYENYGHGLKVAIVSYTGSALNLTVPSKIGGHSISYLLSSAFSDCRNMKSVTISEGIQLVGMSAFQGLTSLEKVTFKGVTDMGDDLFKGCTNLKTVTAPDGYDYIGYDAFNGCSSLETFQIPASVTEIEARAFAYCSSLDGIWVDEDNKVYYSDDYGVVFRRSDNALVCAPGGLKGSYTIPDHVTAICDYAFTGCSNLEEVIMPDSVTTVGISAFQDCSALRTIRLSKNLSDYYPINPGAFTGVTATVYYSGLLLWMESEDYGGDLT